MKQQINFLDQLPKDKTTPLVTTHIVRLAIILSVALITFTLFYSWLTKTLELRANNAELVKSITTIHISTLKKKHSEQFSEAFLSKQLKEISQDVKAKQKIISILSTQKNIPNIEGFSKYFTTLANNTLSNIWLTSIEISQGGEIIKLTGNAQNNDQVLAYLKLLNNASAFSKHPLKLLTLSQDKGISTFILYSESKGNV